jgi:hypothetical protein
MLAKIAHSYCYLQNWGGLKFVPYLAKVIRSQSDPAVPNPDHWLIGDLPDPITSDQTHFVDHCIEEVDGRKLVRVRIKLFCQMSDWPAYEVICGHLSTNTR